jgi:hypothetical protein
MYRIFECRQVLDSLFDRYNASPPKEDRDRKLRALEWNRCLGDLMYEIEEFRAFVIFHDIGKRIEILLYKMRVRAILGYVLALRDIIPLEDQKTKEHYDDWIKMLRKWCEEGNEERLSAAETT